jgi:two-component sensor histidine kinase
LSRLDGCVRVHWRLLDGKLHLDWEESGGPAVAPPSQKGFGSRLLEKLVVHDLGGDIKLDYEVSGVRCRITAKL